MTGTAENCAKPRQRASRPRGSEAAVRCRQQGRARPGGGSVASEMRKPRPLPAAAGQFSRVRSSQRVMSARPKNARPVAQGGAAAPDKYGLAQLLRLRPPATLKGPALTWSERAGPNSGAIRNAAPLGCLNARDERMVDGVGAAGSRRRLRELKNAALTRSRRRAMLGQGAGRLRPSAPAPGPHPPRHQPLRLPPRLATTQDPRDLAVGLALQCRDVGILDAVEVVTPCPPALDFAIRPTLRCVHRRAPVSKHWETDCPQRQRAARRRPSRPHDPQQRPTAIAIRAT